MNRGQYMLIEEALAECIRRGEATPAAAETFVRHLAAVYHAFNPEQFLRRAIPSTCSKEHQEDGNS